VKIKKERKKKKKIFSTKLKGSQQYVPPHQEKNARMIQTLLQKIIFGRQITPHAL
jgi:hypothetical protein